MLEVVAAVDTLTALRHGFDRGLTRPLAWRRSQLLQLKRMLRESEAEWLAALAADLGKPATEGWVTEIGAINGEIDNLLRHLGKWAGTRRVHVPVRLGFGSAEVMPEPLGVVLVIAPWNYPIQLLLLPMAFALAAGNAVVAKPSELAPATSAALARLVPRYLDERAVAIVEGGPAETGALLTKRWDHILYTGNGRVGRIVAEAAAKHLTPVTLELGGRGPTVVDRDANLEVAARRIAWGKFLNAGQSCVAPNHVLVHRDVADELVARLAGAVRDFYGNDPRTSPHFARIVNERHLSRLATLIDGIDASHLVCGGQVVREERYVAPTIVRVSSDPDDALMSDEIFGPILPVAAVDDVDAAIDHVNAQPKPLVLYIFTGQRATADRVIARTSSGAVCVNGTVLQFANPELPFGGVGASGTGAYHGQYGFETFSHYKAVLRRATWPDPSFTYPPYTKLKDRILRWLF